ncbi:RHS repeat protein [Vibrio rotiferianus]|uniref:RHS repeat protein n=1 Tax=Vibrio rotiferianus TaxID=190895 RepID=A0A7Y3Z9T6_9VIBR|nr:RHS repeat-associated core domain-containing protein [Vibrio rotiferianus]NOH49129.1 RHS repeat protein [Vibrio rotiferianus]
MVPQFILPLISTSGALYHLSSEKPPNGELVEFNSLIAAEDFLKGFQNAETSDIERLFYQIGEFPPQLVETESPFDSYLPRLSEALLNGKLKASFIPPSKEHVMTTGVTNPPNSSTKVSSKQPLKAEQKQQARVDAMSAKPQKESCEKDQKAGDPVSLVSGEEILTLTDVELQNGFVWSRTYRSSISDTDQGLGYGWRHNFSFDLKDNHDEKGSVINWEFKNELADVISFTPVSVGATSYQIYVGASCHFLNSVTRVITLANGNQYRFELKREKWLLREIRSDIFSNYQLEYSQNHRLIRIATNKQPTIECQYNDEGRLVELFLPNTGKALATFEYNSEFDLVKASNQWKLTEHYQYTSSHLIIKRVRPTGFAHHFVWEGDDTDAVCIRNYGDLGVYDYQFSFHPPHSSYSNSFNDTWRFVHDEHGKLLEKISPSGRKWTFEYDDLGRKVTETYPDTTKTSYQYNLQGQLVSKLHSSGAINSYEYDSLGQLTKVITPDGESEQVFYNSLGQRVWDSDSQGCMTKYEYDKHGHIIRSTCSDGEVKQWWWDKQQRVVAHELNGTLIRYSHNENGWINGIAYPDGCIASLTYDDTGKRTSVQFYNESDKTGFSEEYSYDEYSRVVRVSTPEGVTQIVWGQLNQQEGIVLADGSSFSYEYDEERNLTKLIRSDGLEFCFSYDQEGELISTQGFDGIETKFCYDSMGRIAEKQVHERTVLYRYDDAGYLSNVRAGNGRFVNESHFSYTLGGKITFASNKHQTLQYHYCPSGNQIKRVQGSFEFTQEYSRLGKLLQVSLPDKTNIAYEYDRYGQVSAVIIEDDARHKVEFNYDKTGRICAFKSNDFIENKVFDGIGRLKEQCWPDRKKSYLFNASNHISTIVDSVFGKTHFHYDKLGQLIRVNSPKNIQSFCFDSFGNPQLPDCEVHSDRVDMYGNMRYKYDSQGNQVSAEGNGYTQTRVFDALNQLIEVHLFKGICQFEYDALGRRTRKISENGIREFFWEGERLIGEYFSGSFRWYFYQPETYIPLALYEDGHVYFYQCDQVGKPEVLKDIDGRTVWQATYDTFGYAHIDIEEVVNPLRFQGQYFDCETQLHYNLARYYDPTLGRFIQQDPISIAGGVNHYQYAINPIQWIDPTGLLCDEGLKRLSKMLVEIHSQGKVPKELCDRVLQAAKETSVGEDGVRSQVKIRKPNGKNHIRYEYDIDHIDCQKNEITFYRHINQSGGSKQEVQYVVGIEDFVNAHVLDSESADGEQGCTIFTENLVLNKAEYKENSELNANDYELTDHNKEKIDKCLEMRKEAMDARETKGHNAQIAKINEQSAKIGELAADDFVRSKYPTAKLLHPQDIETSGSKPGDFDMVYEVEEPRPGEIIIVEAKGGSSPLGSRKIGNEAYQQGTGKYAAEIVKLMSKNKEGTTEKLAADEVQYAALFGRPIRYIHTQASISKSGKASDLKLEVTEFKIDSKGPK